MDATRRCCAEGAPRSTSPRAGAPPQGRPPARLPPRRLRTGGESGRAASTRRAATTPRTPETATDPRRRVRALPPAAARRRGTADAPADGQYARATDARAPREARARRASRERLLVDGE